jgi:exo-1,4-beta-D-glucosaminidase
MIERKQTVKNRFSCLVIGFCLVVFPRQDSVAQTQGLIPEADGALKVVGWSLQSSAQVTETGESLSTPGYHVQGWHQAVVPGTIIGTLVSDKTIPDPNYGINLRNLIGEKKFTNEESLSELPMDMDGPFAVPWWYHTSFTVPENFAGKDIWLKFSGINYRADIWINGKQLTDAKTTVGTWRVFEFNVTRLLSPGAENAIAVRIFPASRTEDLSVSFVDWNPGMPDRYMGLFRDVTLSTSGPVSVRHPAVLSHLDLPDTSSAHLTVIAQLINSSNESETGTLQGSIGDIQFSERVELKPQETRDITLGPGAFPQLNIQNPRLWWPAQMGTPNLYHLRLQFVMNGVSSDHTETRFGIREIASILDTNEHRLFLINGKKLLIRGGGWAMDSMMSESRAKLEDEFRYVADMGLNTIRLEGMFETEDFFNLADEKGILIMAGFSCSVWETWPKWKKEQYVVAEQSLRSQILRLRSHPSLLAFLNGSDNHPPPNVERMYLDIEREYRWPNPVISSAMQEPSLTGDTGVKMTGPYEYVVPEFWMEETDRVGDRGGAFGFNTETGPGPAIPTIESLTQILPKEHLWPVDDWWNFHAGLHDFKDIRIFQQCLNIRYGEATSLEDFAAKSQLMRYEAVRAMYEAFGRNKYDATGVIAWMLNNSWPSMIWNLYDFQLRTGGGYFGTKNAIQALHPLYGYDDNAIWVVSSQYQDARNLKLTAAIYDFNMKQRFSRTETINAKADSTNQIFKLPALPDLPPVYFLKLTLADAAGKMVGSNFYWLNKDPETISKGIVNLGAGFAEKFADFTPLSQLKKVTVDAKAITAQDNSEQVTHIRLENKNSTLAFFLRLNLFDCNSGKEVIPVLWSDNYISLVPGETTELTARYRSPHSGTVRVDLTGWNVNHSEVGCDSSPH